MLISKVISTTPLCARKYQGETLRFNLNVHARAPTVMHKHRIERTLMTKFSSISCNIPTNILKVAYHVIYTITIVVAGKKFPLVGTRLSKSSSYLSK